MPADMKRAAELILWNRRVLSIGGMWPLDSTFVYFYINYIYFITNVALAFVDLYSVFGDMQLMIANLLETSVQMMFGIKMIVLRHSGTLREVLRRIEKGIKEDNYRDDTEKGLYLAYNSIGRSWFQGLNYLAIFTGVIYYIGPMKDFLVAGELTLHWLFCPFFFIPPILVALNNETLPYILPWKTHLFFDIRDARIYAFMYVWQLPLSYYNYCHAASVSFFCTLVVHVTGEMSVLAYRIRRIGSTPDSSNDDENVSMAFEDIIKKHLQIIWQVTAIDDIFNLVLLEELLISTMLFGFVIFNLLSSTGSMYEKLFLANYCIAMLGLILVYCITGDYVISESVNLYKAYYECLWYGMKTKHKKNLIICIARAQQPLQLTAGRFYVFSLPRFSEILKTAMAYVTMLRTVI